MAYVIDTITYQKMFELSQAAVWKTLKNNISDLKIKHITLSESVEQKRAIDYPHVIVPLPTRSETRERADWNVHKVKLHFEIKLTTKTEKDYIELSDLIVYTLDQHQDDTRDAGLSKMMFVDTDLDVIWEKNLDGKIYKTTLFIEYEWNG